MRRTLTRLVIAFAIGIALITAATILQPRFVAGSVADSVCELILMPGKLLAVPFHDRGNASPEFLWRSRVFGSVTLSAIVFLALSARKVSRGDRLEAAHKHCSLHRVELQNSSLCGCFYCFATFAPADISEWIDEGQTAECPKCTIDSVIGSASGYPITAEFLHRMHDKWF